MLVLAQGSVDNAMVAGFYSQLTGVLAGFSFAGLVLVVTARIDASGQPVQPPVHAATDATIALLFSSFVGLVLSSLSYAVIAGETHGSAATSLSHVVAGLGFGVPLCSWSSRCESYWRRSHRPSEGNSTS